MKTPRVSLFAALAAVLVLVFAAASPLMAMSGDAADAGVKGVIQNIDYLHHAITVNGQTYTVSSRAAFQGIAGFSVLHVGMPIRYTLGSGNTILRPSAPPVFHAADGSTPKPPVAETAPSVIVSITWLPGGI